jgi:DNA (cytosine-5)-methyltransferase 1
MQTSLFSAGLQRAGTPVIASASCWYCCGIGVLEATDMFCGAGGSSLGLEFVCCPACGRQLITITQAINHWDLAVEAHNANFPNADHDVHDVHEIPAKRFRRTPVFWASPECVNHTSCKGKRDDSPEAQRSRATFTDIVRFTAYHRYDAVIVENVVEARLWCEHEDCACGGEFDAWYQAMLDEGYVGQIAYFNSQFALPTPQSRDRMYVVFSRVGARLPNVDFRPMSWCSSCTQVVHGIQTWKPASKGSARERIFEWGRYGPQYLYRCPNDGCAAAVAPAVIGARSIINFGLPIERIADKPPTLCRSCGKRHPVACNTRRRIRVGIQNVGSRVPVAVQVGGNLFERAGKARVWSLEDPLRTITGTSCMALVTPMRDGSVPASAAQPTPTVTGRSQLGLVTPAGGQDAAARSIDDAMHTVLGSERLAVVLRTGGQAAAERDAAEPLNTVTSHDRQIGLVMQNMEHNLPRDVDEPSPPVTTRGNHMLVQVNRGDGKDRKRAGRRAWDVDEPTPTIAGHGELGLVEFRGQHGTIREGDAPMHTVTAQGTHHGMLVYNGVPGFVRDLQDAAGTITGRDKQSLLVPYFRTGVARGTDEPLGTVTSHDREALVITDADVDEMFLRMLQWEELLRAQVMDLHPDGTPYQLTASRRNKRGKMVELSNELRTKMIGNAVSCPVATMLGAAVMESLR